MYLCPVVYISVGECKRVCVSHTVKALLVDYSAAGQGFIVLLVTHQRVHAQDGWKKRRRLKNEHLRKKKDRERESKRAVLTLSGLIDWLATLDQTTMHQSLSASQSRQAWGKKKKEKNLHTVWIQLPCTGFDFCNHSWPSALSRPKPNQCAIYFICYKKNNEISASQGKKKSMMCSGSRKSEICFQPSSYSEDTINRESLPCFFVREIESIWLFIRLLNAVKCVYCNKLRGLFTTSISHFKSPSSNSSRVG